MGGREKDERETYQAKTGDVRCVGRCRRDWQSWNWMRGLQRQASDEEEEQQRTKRKKRPRVKDKSVTVDALRKQLLLW